MKEQEIIDVIANYRLEVANYLAIILYGKIVLITQFPSGKDFVLHFDYQK